jgi:cell division GTPase FtsZ
MGVCIMKKIEAFTETQIEIIEKTFDTHYLNVRKAASFINLAKESLINVHGGFNPNVTPDEINDILQTIQELLDPTCSFMCELSVNGEFLLSESNLKEEVTK